MDADVEDRQKEIEQAVAQKRMFNLNEKRQIIDPEHGRYFNVNDLHELVANVPRGTPVRVRSKVAKPIWNANWIVGILISLLAIDWTLRRRWYN